MWVFEPIESVCIFHTLLFFHVWWTYVRCISRTCVTIFRNICHWLHELENDRGIRFTTMAQITIFPKEKNDIIRLPIWAVYVEPFISYHQICLPLYLKHVSLPFPSEQFETVLWEMFVKYLEGVWQKNKCGGIWCLYLLKKKR